MDASWQQVSSRRKNNRDSSVKAIRHYWNGFNADRTHKWFVELDNGCILTEKSPDYNFWVGRFYPNRQK